MTERIDSLTSGCTATTVLIVDDRLFVFNLGNAKAVICSSKEDKYFYKELTVDHNAENETEKQRLLKNKARLVKTNFKDIEGRDIHRISMQYRDEPNLITSRSVGDLYGKSIGVSCQSDVNEYVLDECSKFIVIGTDGLWRKVNEKEMLKIGFENYIKWKSPERAVHEMITLAKTRWLDVFR